MKGEISALLRLSITISLLSISFFFFSDNKVDPDLWGHLKFGEDIVRSRSIPEIDTYSYTAFGSKWTNHEWLSEVIFFVQFDFFGSKGLILLKLFLGILCTGFLYRVMAERMNNHILIWILLALGLSNISFGFATRPQIFTYLFFSSFLFCLHKYDKQHDLKYLLALFPQMLLWTNLHGGFVAGVGTYLVFAVTRVFQKDFIKAVLPAGLLIFLATFINPYGLNLWFFLQDSLLQQRPYIGEWQGVSLSARFSDYFLLVALSIIAIVISKEKKRPHEILLMGILAVLSFKQNRHIPLFSMIALITISEHIESIVKEPFSRMFERINQGILIFSFVVVSFFFIWMGLTFNKANPLKIEIPDDKYPVSAVHFIKENKIKGNLFPYFDWGEYCIWKLHKSNRVFFDGRFETVYKGPLRIDYFKVLHGQEDPKRLLKSHPETDIMLLPPDNPLLLRLNGERDWIEVFRSDAAVILLKENETNQDALFRYWSGLFRYPVLHPPHYID
jgi:hypothetical protein